MIPKESRKSKLWKETCRQNSEKQRRQKHMKQFFKEFKEFIARGNVMDMAVGIIIGSAFTAIVSSLVEDIISPILGLFGGINFDQLSVNLLGEVTLNYGKFLSAVVNFLIMALIVFIIIKIMNKAASTIAPKEEQAPTTKKCPYCKSEIPIDAVRCPHCTSKLDE
jgi:large conductance mechanosensitive channel